MPKLKVFRTSTGFHDAYVAAPSQKAALKAWGTESNLFAQGLAEQVTDEALMADALAQPGAVVKKLRGTEAEHFAALGPMPEKRTPKTTAETKPASPPATAAKLKPVPRPGRDALDAANLAVEQAIAKQKAAVAAIDDQIEALRKKRRLLEETHRQEISKLENHAKRERTLHDTAMKRWRG